MIIQNIFSRRGLYELIFFITLCCGLPALAASEAPASGVELSFIGSVVDEDANTTTFAYVAQVGCDADPLSELTIEIPTCSEALSVTACDPIAGTNNCANATNLSNGLTGITWQQTFSPCSSYPLAIVFAGKIPEQSVLAAYSDGAVEYTETTGASCAPYDFTFDCANPTTIDFNDLDAGTWVTNQYSDLGVRIWGINLSTETGNPNENHPDKAITLDSSNPPAHDMDLLTPNPPPDGGEGNTEPLRMVLIGAENDFDLNGDGLVDDPDDEADGFRIIFQFKYDGEFEPALLSTLDILDIEDPDSVVKIYPASGGVISQDIRSIEDSSHQTMNLGNIEANYLKIDFDTSGAVDDLVLCLPCAQDDDADGTNNCSDQCPANPNKTEPGICGCDAADTDTDGDGTPDCNDQCPTDPNKVVPGVCGCGVVDRDADRDGTPDCNDQCPTDPNKIEPGVCGCGTPDTDSDGDGVPDCNDQCPSDPDKIAPGECGCDADELDSDGDGTPDCSDECPTDPKKVKEGVCGCGVSDVDSDGDGTPDCNDGCPSDPNKTAPGACGCGMPDTDTDGDGTPDCSDQCPSDPNKTTPGTCGCGVADADTDGDGTPNCQDNCLSDPNKTEPGVCGCGAPDEDTDGDGIPDCGEDQCPDDPNKTVPGVCGCLVPDVDTDGDGTLDCNENCPNDPNKTEPGICGCGASDTDLDGDGAPDCADTCFVGFDLCGVCGGDGTTCLDCTAQNYSESQFVADASLKSAMKIIRLGWSKWYRLLQKAGVADTKSKKLHRTKKRTALEEYLIGWFNVWAFKSDFVACGVEGAAVCTASSNLDQLTIYFDSNAALQKLAKQLRRRIFQAVQLLGMDKAQARKFAQRKVSPALRFLRKGRKAAEEIPTQSFDCSG